MVPRSVPGSVSPEYKGSSLIVPFGGAPRRRLREKCEKRRKCWARVAETLSARPDPGVVRQVVPFGKIGAFLSKSAEKRLAARPGERPCTSLTSPIAPCWM